MRALHRKIFEDQMRALEQQQQQELLTLPLDTSGNSSLQHLAMSAPTTPPRVNAVLNEDISPSLRTSFAQVGVDVDVDIEVLRLKWALMLMMMLMSDSCSWRVDGRYNSKLNCIGTQVKKKRTAGNQHLCSRGAGGAQDKIKGT